MPPLSCYGSGLNTQAVISFREQSTAVDEPMCVIETEVAEKLIQSYRLREAADPRTRQAKSQA